MLTGAAGGREPLLFDARTGAARASPFPPDWRIRAATFVSNTRVAWLVDRGSAGHLIITCGPAGQCEHPVAPPGPGVPLIAEDSTR